MHIVVSGQEIVLDGDNNILIPLGATYTELEHSTNAVTTAPGTYDIWVVEQTNGTGAWNPVAAGDFQNPITVTILPPPGTITVTAPNGGETFDVGQTLSPISWTTTGNIGNITIELESFPSQEKIVIADNIPNSSPYNSYTLPLCATGEQKIKIYETANPCLLYTSPSPRDRTRSRMPSSA